MYKTTKPSKKSGNSHGRLPVLDLHGYTKNEALIKLVDTAMQGHHPWVIEVQIICGAENQILSEVVETWMRQNKTVCNASKNV